MKTNACGQLVLGTDKRTPCLELYQKLSGETLRPLK